MRTLALAALIAAALCPLGASAQSSSSKYNACVAQAQQQSGWYGESGQNKNQHAPLYGAAGGAIGGSLIGGMGGGNAGRGAAIGAAFGAVAGSVRKNKTEQSQQNQQQTYYNVLNACMAQ